MCGINGIVRLDESRPPVDRAELIRTRDRMASRGPDAVGEWIAPDSSVGLGHRRLSIIDLSPAGTQPMSWASGRYRIVFNGEIYNYRELREELLRDGVEFRSHSDTEVVLALYAREGASMLGRLRGMYAFAIWDAEEKRLLLARGPYGIKPLYYAEGGGYLRFASQVKALEAGGAVPMDVDPAGLAGFLEWGSVPEPSTIRKKIRALPAGCHLVVERGRVGAPVQHHRLRLAGSGDPSGVGEAIADSVRAHLVSDVPVGVYLSAGMDSNLIAHLASREVRGGLTSLTITFREFEGTPSDEGPLAATLARIHGLCHVERRVSREDLVSLWPACLEAMDQPSVDGLNTYLVSRIAHEEGFKVVLSGLGGDEIFGSYPSFRQVPRWSRQARVARKIPGLDFVLSRIASEPLLAKPKLAGFLRYGGSLPGAYFLRRAVFLPEELPAILGEDAAEEALAAFDPVEYARGVLREQIGDEWETVALSPDRAWEIVHVLESFVYMRNQLLRDSDWASMAHSLELRVPLVDARLQEEIAALGFDPARSHGKAAVLRGIAPDLPEELLARPKSGFGIPVANWIAGMEGTKLTPGGSSRTLALAVLDAFGIEHLPSGPASGGRARGA
jgi:asparagine synthase (glutamine-hydrolysing)